MEQKSNKYDVVAMVRRMMKILKQEDPKQIWRMIAYTVVAGIYPFMAVILPKLAIGIIEQKGSEATKPLIIAMVIYFVVAGFLAFYTGFLAQVMEAENMRIRLRYIVVMSKKFQSMDYKYIEDSKFAEKYDKAINSCNNNSFGVEGMYNHIVKLPAKLITLIAMMVLACVLSPLVLLAIVVHVIVTMWAARKTHNYQYARKEELAKAGRKKTYYRKTTNDFTFGKDIRIFNLRNRILSNYQAEIDAYTSLNKKIKNKEYLYGFAGLFTLLLSNVVMYGILIYKAYMGMPISSFTMYVSLITGLMQLMLAFGEDLSFIQNEGQYVDDFFRLVDANLTTEGDRNADAGGKNKNVEIVFDHVTFRYPNTEKDIFKDFSFTIHAGERLAIVGINGAGKSTLVKLICGLYAPTEGHIYVNGIDINEYKKEELYKLYGTVFQDFNIIAFTIKENVAGKSKYIDEERVLEALSSVGLGEKVKGFEKGLDQMMLKIIDENGTDFSGGERQKLAIARALYKDAPMVIMDEPTAALDALAEADIYESFSNLVKGKTAIYVSHRLASTKFCDRIALFDQDGLKEYGTHDELMEKKGLYYEMFVVQGKYYQEQEEIA